MRSGWRRLTAVVLAAGALLLALPLAAPAAASGSLLDVTSSADGTRWWTLSSDGSVTPGGQARQFGDAPRGAVAIGARPAGDGYWSVDRAGRVTVHGAARHYGDMSGTRLNAPVVHITPTGTGKGYWLLAADGGVFSYGDAAFYGSTGSLRLVAPIVGMAATRTGKGYWLVAADGGIFSYGDATFFGSAAALRLVAPIVGMAATGSGRGYWLVAADGGVFSYGDAPFKGSSGGGSRRDAVAVTGVKAGYAVGHATGAVGVYTSPDKPPMIASPLEREVFDRINRERAARGIAPIVWDQTLNDTAVAWASDMAAHGAFRHSNVLATLKSLTPAYSRMAENLYLGTGSGADAGSAHVALMKSPLHRRTLLDPAFTHGAVGAVCVDGVLWLTEHVARSAKLASAAMAPIPPEQPITASTTGGVSC